MVARNGIAMLEDGAALRRQRREWVAERIGWVLVLTALAGASLGVFGDGPLSRCRRHSSDGELIVEYERVARADAPESLRILVGESHGERPLRVLVSRSFADRIVPHAMVPRPVLIEEAGENVAYVYDAPAHAARREILMRYEFRDFGRIDYRVGVEEGPAVRVQQWVLP